MSLFKSLAIVGATLLPTASSADWSGYYLGASVGNVTEGELEYNTGLVQEIEEAMPFGFFIGYQSQNGRLVFGGEFAYAAAEDIELENAIVDVAYGEGDLKARLGYDFGNVLGYGVISRSAVAVATSAEDIVASGLGFGFGADIKVSHNFTVGAEFMFRDLNGEYEINDLVVDDDVDFRANTINLRASVRF